MLAKLLSHCPRSTWRGASTLRAIATASCKSGSAASNAPRPCSALAVASSWKAKSWFAMLARCRNDLTAAAVSLAPEIAVVLDRLETALAMLHGTIWHPTAIVAAGGVAANQRLREALEAAATLAGMTLVVPPAELCTDNGAMIAWAGAERLARGLTDGLDARARARWPLATAESSA